jgi:hypothetical protein
MNNRILRSSTTKELTGLLQSVTRTKKHKMDTLSAPSTPFIAANDKNSVVKHEENCAESSMEESPLPKSFNVFPPVAIEDTHGNAGDTILRLDDESTRSPAMITTTTITTPNVSLGDVMALLQLHTKKLDNMSLMHGKEVERLENIIHERVEHLDSKFAKSVSMLEENIKLEQSNLQQQIYRLRDESTLSGIGSKQSLVIGDTHSTLQRLISKRIEDLPQFNGRGDNVTDWIDQLEAACQRAKMMDNEILLTAELKLKGDALKWFNINREVLTNWSDFRIKLENRFALVRSDDVVSNNHRLTGRVQGIDESSAQYVTAMEALCRKYRQTMSNDERVAYMTRGARPEFQQLILLRHPKTPDELLAVMHDWEKLQDISDREGLPSSTSPLLPHAHTIVRDLPNTMPLDHKSVMKHQTTAVSTERPTQSNESQLAYEQRWNHSNSYPQRYNNANSNANGNWRRHKIDQRTEQTGRNNYNHPN